MEQNDSIQRRIKANQMQREVRRTQLKVRRIFAIVRFLIVLCLIFFTYRLVKCHYWYVNKAAFNSPQNQYLKIVGNEITPDYKILDALRKIPIENHPVYVIDTAKMAKEVMKIDTIKRVYIRRFWMPGRFTVIVDERKPLLIISPKEKVPPIAFFTEEGKLIGREYLPLRKSYNTTLVLTYGTRGDDYRHWDLAKIKLLDKLSKSVTAYSKEKVLYIDMRNPRDVYVQIPSAKLRLGDLDYSVFKRIQSISSILPEVKSFQNKVKYVDLRWEETNYLKLKYNTKEGDTPAEVIED
ncbi:MAG: FtsQ-type POTRA domain-containing protein [Candidatus Gastranaerophilales bacterium]|nr:FtsQ-type POTRA domain-containing protein [Candidatus Gastranaerophilales bacterium]